MKPVTNALQIAFTVVLSLFPVFAIIVLHTDLKQLILFYFLEVLLTAVFAVARVLMASGKDNYVEWLSSYATKGSSAIISIIVVSAVGLASPLLVIGPKYLANIDSGAVTLFLSTIIVTQTYLLIKDMFVDGKRKLLGPVKAGSQSLLEIFFACGLMLILLYSLDQKFDYANISNLLVGLAFVKVSLALFPRFSTK